MLARYPWTLSLAEDSRGLWQRAVLDTSNQTASDLVAAIRRGDVSQMSVGFIVAEDRWSGDGTIRTIGRFASLIDVSAVGLPASPTTSISVARSDDVSREVRRARAQLDIYRRRYRSMHDTPLERVARVTVSASERDERRAAATARRAAMARAGGDYRTLLRELRGDGRDEIERR